MRDLVQMTWEKFNHKSFEDVYQNFRKAKDVQLDVCDFYKDCEMIGKCFFMHPFE